MHMPLVVETWPKVTSHHFQDTLTVLPTLMTLLQILLEEAFHQADEEFHLEDGVHLGDEEIGVAVDCANNHFASQ